MDAEYLRESVGEPLAAALTSLALKQPKDPVDFIGQYLIKYADYLEAKVAKADTVQELEAKQGQLNEEVERVQAVQAAHAALDKHRLETEESKIASLQGMADSEFIYSTVVESVKEATHATGVYLGKKIDVLDASPFIKYIASDRESAWMVGKILKGDVGSGDAGEEGARGQQPEGVTFRVWEGLPAVEGEAEEPAATEEGGEGEGEEAGLKPPTFPEYIHIKNVLREPHVKFFGVPKLGAYLAVPVTYPSGLHDDGIAEAFPSDESIAASSEESQQENEGEGEEGENQPIPAPASEDAPRYVKVNKNIQLVLGLDCTGQARSFTPLQIAAAVKWGKALASALEAADTKLWNEEVARLDDIIKKEASSRSTTVMKIKAQLQDVAQSIEGMGEDSPAEEKKLEEKDLVFQTARTAMTGSKAYLTKLPTLIIKPNKALHFFRLAQAAVTVLGLSVADASLSLTWESLRDLLGEAFWEKVEGVAPDLASENLHSKEDVEGLRNMLEGISEEELEGACLESYLFFKYIIGLLDLTDAIWEKREADEAAAAVAAEAGGAEEGEGEAEGEAD